jgi:hypothetical protein
MDSIQTLVEGVSFETTCAKTTKSANKKQKIKSETATVAFEKTASPALVTSVISPVLSPVVDAKPAAKPAVAATKRTQPTPPVQPVKKEKEPQPVTTASRILNKYRQRKAQK